MSISASGASPFIPCPVLLLEYWKPIVGFDGYLISITGRVINSRTNKELKQAISHWGYPKVRVSYERKSHNIFVHKLVITTFTCSRPDGYEINHIDGWKLNRRISNLEYVTRKQNFQHAAARGLMNGFSGSKRSPLTTEDIATIRSRVFSIRELVAKYQLSKSYLREIRAGREIYSIS